jgi:hypothetical protein
LTPLPAYSETISSMPPSSISKTTIGVFAWPRLLLVEEQSPPWWFGALDGTYSTNHTGISSLWPVMHVHRGGGLLAGPSANGSTRVEQGVIVKCTNEPPAIGRVSEVSPADLYRGKPDSLKEALRFRLPTRRTLSLPQELGEHD